MLQQRALTPHQGKPVLHCDLHPAFRKAHLCPPCSAMDNVANLNPIAADIDVAGLEERHVEQVGDEPGQPAGFLLNGGEQIGLVAAERKFCTVSPAICTR